MSASIVSPSTAATRRPTSRSCATTARVLALVRGGMSSPHHIGLDGSRRAAAGAVRRGGREQAGRRRGRWRTSAQVLLAGPRLPDRGARAARRARRARAGARALTVGNDTFAVLRAGTERGWGVAVVCGAGINCVGVGARRPPRALPGARRDQRRLGRRLRRRPRGAQPPPRAARTAAARARGSSRRCPRYFGKRTPSELAEAIHLGEIPQRRLVELAAGRVRARRRATPVAAELVDRLAAEVVVMAEVALRRLELAASPVEVLLGGGMFQRADSGWSTRCARAGRRRRIDHRARDRGAADRRRGAARAGRAGGRRRGAGARAARARRARGNAEREADLWLRCGSSRRRASIRAATRPRWTRSTWRSATAS